MAEDLIITGRTREEKYAELVPQITALVEGEIDLIANMANISAALKTVLDFFWVGFYVVKGDELVLAPFQGPVACTRISRGKGVCGKCWEEERSIIVDDVDQFPGHIACSSLSKSEIVIPLRDEAGKIWAVLDVDSDKLNDFGETDRSHLEKICKLIRRTN
jgi:L-methionine (R)-S-oxide reductase